MEPPNLQEAVKEALSGVDKKLTEFLATFRTEAEEIKKSAEFMNTKYEEVMSELHTVKARLNSVENEPVRKGPNLDSQIEEISQYQRRNNIVFSGIPESKDEDLYDIVCGTARALGVSIGHGDLDIVHRLPSQKNGKPRLVLAKIVCRRTKEDIMNSYFLKKKSQYH